MAISPSMVVAAQTTVVDVQLATVAPSVKAAEAAKADLSYITPEAVIAGVAYPRRVLIAHEMEMMPLEVMTAAGLKEIGVDPMDIESVTFMVATLPMPNFGAVFRFVKPYSLADLKPNFTKGATKTELDGRPCLAGATPMEPSFYMPDDKTLLIATGPAMQGMLAAHKAPKKGPESNKVVTMLEAADKGSDIVVVADIETVRPMILAALSAAPEPVPPPFDKAASRLPRLISSIKLELAVTSTQPATLELNTADEAAAKEVEEIINELVDTGVAIMQAEMTKEMPKSNDPVELAGMKYGQRISKKIVEMLRPTRDGKVVKFTTGQAPQAQQQVAVIGILVALLLPAVQAAREAARRTQSMNNLKQIGLGLLNYESAKKHFPQRANFDKDGKPLLSWRVHILPYMEQRELYNQFKLDEPWDSPNNLKLIERMPEFYRDPSNPAPVPSGKADYLALTGPGSVFEGQNKTSFRAIKDGTSNTIAVVEVNPARAAIWTKPDDLNYDKSDPTADLGGNHPGIFLALFCDGSVQFISNGIDSELLLRLFQMNDGQPFNLP